MSLRLFPLLLALLTAGATEAAPPRLPVVDPSAAGANPRRLAIIDDLVARAIRDRQMPGCVIAVGRHGKLCFLKAYGDRAIEPEREPMTTDTVFDLASLTKPIATATSVALLIDAGKLSLDDRVVRQLPEFAPHGKDEISLLQLLTHQTGLIPDNRIEDYQDGPEHAWKQLCNLELRNPPGKKFEYSDVNFIVLGKAIERVTERPLDEFTREKIFAPLGMSETGYRPGPELSRRAAPTERRDGNWLRGQVHDPRCALLGGVAGHAGLFSTAEDLAVYAQMLLNGGEYGGVRVLSREAVERMFAPHEVSSGLRSAGWDMRTGFSSNRGDLMSPRAVGHGGFTGTALWIDPELDMFIIFLSNRVHPDGKGLVNPLIGRISTVAISAFTDE
ncbi:MAG TPA: serine hydrolase domain-containing protein [Planctomycetaceae bacterium]|nr:serine hydrolase domain-containing protein [Planctomycetaceae bacterium]